MNHCKTCNVITKTLESGDCIECSHKAMATELVVQMTANDQLKKDLLNLLPIARENTSMILNSVPMMHEWGQCEDELKFIDELTAKYGKGKNEYT